MKSVRIFCEPPRPRGSGVIASRDVALPRRRRWLRRITGFSSWIGPAAVLALIPKCPACLGAYIAFGTGVGLSVKAAGVLRTSLILLSVLSLAWLVLRSVSIPIFTRWKRKQFRPAG